MTTTLLDFIKSRGTSHIKGLFLLNPPDFHEACTIIGCSKHRKLGDKNSYNSYNKIPKETYLKDYYNHKIM